MATITNTWDETVAELQKLLPGDDTRVQDLITDAQRMAGRELLFRDPEGMTWALTYDQRNGELSLS